jgi:hypothetical protein
MWDLLQWLGIGGFAGSMFVLWFAPQIVPAFAARTLAGAADGLSEAVRYVGGKLNDGGRVIFASGSATFTLIFAIVVADIVQPLRFLPSPSLPSWFQSQPAAAPESKPERAKAKQSQRSAAASAPKARSKSAFEEITCALKPGGCAQ